MAEQYDFVLGMEFAIVRFLGKQLSVTCTAIASYGDKFCINYANWGFNAGSGLKFNFCGVFVIHIT